MPGGGRNGRRPATKTMETNHRRLFQQTGSSSFLRLNTLWLSISYHYCFSHNVSWCWSYVVKASFNNTWVAAADWSPETRHVSGNWICALNDLWVLSGGGSKRPCHTPVLPPQMPSCWTNKCLITLSTYITSPVGIISEWRIHNLTLLCIKVGGVFLCATL